MSETTSGTCDQRRRDDDHLCLVAGISKSQINELRQRGVTTLTALSQLPLPLANAFCRCAEMAEVINPAD